MPVPSSRARGVVVGLVALLAGLIAAPVAGQESSATPSAVAVAPTLHLGLDRSAARNGDLVTATVTLRNPGGTPLLVGCGRPVEVWADIANVVAGERVDWTESHPWRRGMRKALLGDPADGTGPLAVSFRTTSPPTSCPDSGSIELAPGEESQETLTWRVGYPDGSPLAGPDETPAIIRARVRPVRSRAQVRAGDPQPDAIEVAMPLSLTTARNGRIVPPAQAVEALFRDAEAARWLDLEHASSWRRADLRLVRGRWRIDIRRVAAGCCRETLAAELSATTGRVLSVDAQTFDWTPARTRYAYFDQLLLRIDLQRNRFRDGRATRMRVTVTNLSEEDSVWFWSHDNACTDQPGLWIAAGPERSGARWKGRLGRFKKFALKGEVILARAGPPGVQQCRSPEPVWLGPERSVSTESFFRPDLVPAGQRTLQAVGRIDLVGSSPSANRPWRVYASPSVRAKFKIGDGSEQIPSPAMIIDAALRDPVFARRIKGTARKRWEAAGVTGTSVWLELRDGTRIVGVP
jgi:hypothetical protein